MGGVESANVSTLGVLVCGPAREVQQTSGATVAAIEPVLERH